MAITQRAKPALESKSPSLPIRLSAEANCLGHQRTRANAERVQPQTGSPNARRPRCSSPAPATRGADNVSLRPPQAYASSTPLLRIYPRCAKLRQTKRLWLSGIRGVPCGSGRAPCGSGRRPRAPALTLGAETFVPAPAPWFSRSHRVDKCPGLGALGSGRLGTGTLRRQALASCAPAPCEPLRLPGRQRTPRLGAFPGAASSDGGSADDPGGWRSAQGRRRVKRRNSVCCPEEEEGAIRAGPWARLRVTSV
jgi:hypothetical protein